MAVPRKALVYFSFFKVLVHVLHSTTEFYFNLIIPFNFFLRRQKLLVLVRVFMRVIFVINNAPTSKDC